MRRALFMRDGRDKRMQSQRIQRQPQTEPFEQREAALAGGDHNGVRMNHVDFARTARHARPRRQLHRRALAVEANRRDLAAEHELHAALVVQCLLDQFGKQRAIGGAFVIEQHAARELRLGAHRMLVSRAFRRTEYMVRHLVAREQAERRLNLLPFVAGTHQIEQAARLFELVTKAGFHVRHRLARGLDQWPQQPVLAAE